MRSARLALIPVLMLSGFGLGYWTEKLERVVRSPYPLTRTLPHRASGVPLSELADLGAAPVPLSLERGQTLGGVLEGLGVDGGEAARIGEELGRHVDLRRLKEDDLYTVHLGPDRRLERLELVVGRRGRAAVARGVDGEWSSEYHAFARTVAPRVVRGRLEGSLEESIRRAGGEPVLAILMSEVLQWDVDFTRDLRVGDVFEVAYERVFLDGTFDAPGGILALTFENRGRRLEAFRFGGDSLYYDAEGRPLRKMFLRSPLRYSRVTSRFSRRRFHPVLKRYRPHYGVDYGAPTGTPVRVTASGTVGFAGWDRGGGKTVRVRHPNGYETAYLHLSRFASGINRGRRVIQGDVVGYVGSTGLSTAPHLDYRVRHRGAWIDPLMLKSVPAKPLPPEQLAQYFAWRDRLRAALAGRLELQAEHLAAEMPHQLELDGGSAAIAGR